ncbi:lytic polysaccharide monooxygenase [Rhizobium sp. LC145]|uniref:lytic polysaccharide monooxygenase n=1 Tax=Rhizobium sp. LC145 TaxID=1120688 RepID=UPI000629FE3D|nr:lytic polysaccharide monooxygenase [Rhizobium sp. LC145]KKX33931.1 hypothetical protein YH62_01780 [Rhizobium sp. LC145]TKT44259.1 hypothetical protein FDR95_26190 [Rhizobiaceae bacterium LC148]
MKWMNGLMTAGLIVLGGQQTITPAFAHGALEFPPARQKWCFLQNDWGGDNLPANEACRKMKVIGGEYPFTQWHEYAHHTKPPGDLDTVKKEIADGQLCSGTVGTTRKAAPHKGYPIADQGYPIADRYRNRNSNRKDGVNEPSNAWHVTDIITKNGNFELVFDGSPAPHRPSYWQVFLTKPGYDFSQRLKWDDLDLITEVGDTPYDEESKRFKFDVTVPDGRTGKAILYVRWQRYGDTWFESEGFYSCADINLIAEDSEPPSFDKGYFISRGLDPQPGERLRFRLFSAPLYSEKVDVYLDITAANQKPSIWAKQLADKLNQGYGSQLRVGIRQGDAIEYNDQLPYENKVYVASEEDSFAISIEDGNSNLPPLADAGQDTAVVGPTTITLNGTGSSDPDGDPLAYHWHLHNTLEGVVIDNPNAATTAVTIPSVTERKELIFMLRVTDDKGAASTDTVTVTVNPSNGGGYNYVWPDGIENYEWGKTVVLGVDGNLWKCKPFPQGAWCKQNVPAYTPGGPDMAPNPEQQPWERYTPPARR